MRAYMHPPAPIADLLATSARTKLRIPAWGVDAHWPAGLRGMRVGDGACGAPRWPFAEQGAAAARPGGRAG